MQRSSQQSHDEIIWNSAGLVLGAVGLDLRQPAVPNALAKLINARFRDTQTVERRNGYISRDVQDGSGFGSAAPGTWVYGVGRDYPIIGQAKGIFRYGDSDVVWTGDRLLVMRDAEPALGSSEFWSRGDGVETPQGIPAYIPVMTDSSPPDVVSGDYVETALTEELRGIVASGEGETLTAWVVSRENGTLLDSTVLEAGGTSIRTPRIINSAGTLVVLWRDDTVVRMRWWGGTSWSLPVTVAIDVDHFDVAATDAGFYIMWREAGALKVGRYAGHSITNSTPAFGKDLGLTTSGCFAFDVAEDGGAIAVAYQDGLQLRSALFDSAGDNGDTALLSSAVGPWNCGMAVRFRMDGESFVVHATNGDLYTKLYECDGIATPVAFQEETRYQTHLASKSFRVGDEIFCWMRARNSETNYLVAGVTKPQMSGVCDREEAILRAVNDGVKAIPAVSPDPLDPEYTFTWARPYTTGDDYSRPGNIRVGDLNFMPQLSTAAFGDSVYIAGSLVRNWDGVELGDAGFHDYPEVDNNTPQQTSGGSLTLLGTYRYRVYAVRYNRRGERFMSAAITTNPITLSGSNQKVTLLIFTVPATNHDDVVFEVYRTENGGTTYYLDGTIANDLGAQSVTYESTIADTALIAKLGDSHAAGVGNLSEVEEYGPVGCSMLAVSADRLWGAGGQVPRGWVQFSKLKEPNEGAGFDTIAGFQEVDTEGGVITSIAGAADGTVVFEQDRFYLIASDGPNNYGQGAFSVPQLQLADGATHHVSTLRTPVGVVYWGADGPRLLPANYRVANISAPVQPLTKSMTPSGVQIDLARQEVVWFSEDGNAVLWNYQNNNSRWAQWTGLHVAGCSLASFVTTDGKVLIESEDAYGDGGVPFEFAGSSGELNSGSLGGDTELGRVGIAGKYLGPHRLRFRIFYNGSPLWSDQWIWQPDDNTWLALGTDHEGRTPAQIDADKPTIKSGGYATHKKVNRHTCRHFRVEWSDISAWRPTYQPHELSLEVGSRPGMGRVPTNTFGS